VIGISQIIESTISGWAVSGRVLIAAGASKLPRLPGFYGAITIRRALQMPKRQWRLFGLAAGGVDWADWLAW
jgi:hypothetical protein